MRILMKAYQKIFSITTRLLFILEIFLFLRLTLKFLAANPKALIVNLIYRGSDILIFPFKYIFSNIQWRGYLIETSTFSAMLGYALLVYIIFKILRLFSED